MKKSSEQIASGTTLGPSSFAHCRFLTIEPIAFFQEQFAQGFSPGLLGLFFDADQLMHVLHIAECMPIVLVVIGNLSIMGTLVPQDWGKILVASDEHGVHIVQEAFQFYRGPAIATDAQRL